MADVHFLGEVRGRILDHHALRFGNRAHAEPGIVQYRIQALGEEIRSQRDVDEARTGDFDLAGNAGEVQLVDHLLGQLARVHLALFGGRHHAIGLEVAELGAACRLQQRLGIRNTSRNQGGSKLVMQELGQGHRKSFQSMCKGRARELVPGRHQRAEPSQPERKSSLSDSTTGGVTVQCLDGALCHMKTPPKRAA